MSPKQEAFFDIRKHENQSYRVKSLKDIKDALKKLGLYNASFSYMSGMPDIVDDDYKGLYFFSSKPSNLSDDSVDEITNTKQAVSGKIMALFLYTQYNDPSIELYKLTPNKKLGGWDIWGRVDGDDAFIAAERVLLGSDRKSH